MAKLIETNIYKKHLTKPSASMDAEQAEPSYPAGGGAKGDSHFGKCFDSFLHS